MEIEASQTPYEVVCQRCRVSFPVGTRVCVHCGGRIGRELPAMPPLGVPGPIEELPEEELPPRARLLSPFAVLWLLLAFAGALYRQCG